MEKKNETYCWSQATSEDFYNKAPNGSVGFSHFFSGYLFACRNSLPSHPVPPPSNSMGQPLAALSIPQTTELFFKHNHKNASAINSRSVLEFILIHSS